MLKNGGVPKDAQKVANLNKLLQTGPFRVEIKLVTYQEAKDGKGYLQPVKRTSKNSFGSTGEAVVLRGLDLSYLDFRLLGFPFRTFDYTGHAIRALPCPPLALEHCAFMGTTLSPFFHLQRIHYCDQWNAAHFLPNNVEGIHIFVLIAVVSILQGQARFHE